MRDLPLEVHVATIQEVLKHILCAGAASHLHEVFEAGSRQNLRLDLRSRHAFKGTNDDIEGEIPRSSYGGQCLLINDRHISELYSCLFVVLLAQARQTIKNLYLHAFGRVSALVSGIGLP